MANLMIVGGGVAGLSAGIFARLHGHGATVLERHSLPGGNLTGWQRGPYHIDNCIHWLTGTNPASKTYALWKTLGALDGVRTPSGPALYTCERDGRRLSLDRSADRLRAAMLALAPDEQPGIDGLFGAVEAIQGLLGIAGPNHDRASPPLRRLRDLRLLASYYPLTAGDLAARFRHPLLRAFIADFLTEDFGALGLLAVWANYCGNNGGLPAGGSLAMAERLAARFEDLGGVLRLNAEAGRITLNGTRATGLDLKDGAHLTADYYVLAGDPAAALPGLLGLPLPPALARRYRDPRLRRFSSVQAAFACEGLPPFTADAIYPLPDPWAAVLGARRLILRDFSHERDFAPRGETVVQALLFCDETACRAWLDMDGETYAEKKKALARNLRLAAEAVCPALRGRLSLLDVWTPRTYKRYVGSEVGSWMSFAFSGGILPRWCGNRVRGAKNVILATQWLQAPGGLPIAAESGRRAIQTVDRMERIHR